MPGDPANPPGNTSGFTGYADPSMRRDPANTNLWMLYSFPKPQTGYGNPQQGNQVTDVVEIHLAESLDSGTSWTATSPPAIWPSVWNSAGGTHGQFSSHEVANFWAANGSWYAVHLMYFVPVGGTIAPSIQDGCLVTTVAATPAGLGANWAGYSLSNCSAAPPNGNNHFVLFGDLATKAGLGALNCTVSGDPCSWGEPAIMVQNGIAYLAVSCYDKNFVSLGYFLFTSDTTLATWTYTHTSFNLSTLKTANSGASFPSSWQFLTEFDWAARSDNNGSDVVAIVTPASVGSGGETQYGCLAVNFSLTSGFGAIVASVYDEDSPGSGPSEVLGPNACTYEPTSNTGILIVRRLLYPPNNYFVVSLIDTGVMP